MKSNPVYTDEWNENASEKQKAFLGRWSLVTLILILIAWFWSGIPESLSLVERGNTAVYLISLSFIYRHFFFKALFFVCGFLGLITFLSKILG